MLHRELLVNGTFLGGPCDGGIGKEVARSPWSAQVIGSFAEAGWPEADAAIDSAAEAFFSWRSVDHSERQALCARIAQSIRDRRDELANLVMQEAGKPITFALAEVDRTAITFDLSAQIRMGPESHALDYDPRGHDYRASVRRFPIGVILAIAPYNWPFNLSAHKIGPALATGNTVVLKGAGQAGLCSLTLARIIHEAGCPAGVFNAVQVANPIAERMVQDPRIAALSFTGSPAVGWKLKGMVTKKRVTLELGGNAFAIVASDADLDAAVERLVRSAYGYAGQVCISTQNILVHQSVCERFWEKFASATRAIRAMDPASPDAMCGPVIDEPAAVRIGGWVEKATGEKSNDLEVHGNRVEPIAVRIEDFGGAQASGLELVTQEVFGPVATVSPYSTVPEAIRWINRGEYGIHTSYFGRSSSDAEELYEGLDISGLIINDAPTVRFDGMPYGGQKLSGFGREGVALTAEEFTVPKVRVDRLS